MAFRRYLEIFFGTLRILFNFLISTGKPEILKHINIPLAKFLNNKAFCSDPEGRKILRTVFEKLTEGEQITFRKDWEAFLSREGTKISSDFVCELVMKKARKGV